MHLVDFPSPVINLMSFCSPRLAPAANVSWLSFSPELHEWNINLWFCLLSFNSVHMWDTPVVITSNFGFEDFI